MEELSFNPFGSKYSYHQTVAGAFESYTYSGESQQMKANLSRLLSRGSLHKTYVNAALWTKKSHNYINDTEIEVQRRRTAGWEVGLNHTQYIGETVLQLFANYKRGTGGNKSLPAPEEEFGEGTSRMQILLQALILPILSLSAISLSVLTPAGMDNGTAHL